MAINKKLIHFKNFSDFNSKKLSANENNTQYTLGINGAVTNGSPEILYQSICYIKDTKQQWTHGQLYDGSKSDTPLNETDPIFSASPAATITNEDKALWNGKQDAISDLEAIRNGAMKGATAVQSETLAGYALEGYVDAEVKALGDSLARVASSGSYNDLSNKPTIPSAVTESTVSGWGFTKNTGTYSKPSGGIPKSDLASAVQTSLGKADTAVQPEDIKDDVYIVDFTMEELRQGAYDGDDVECQVQSLINAMNANKVILVRESTDSAYKGVRVLSGYAEDLLYFSIVDFNGEIIYCDGTDYINNDSFISGDSLHVKIFDTKQDALVSGENIKTINGESILGSGDITIESSGGTITGVSANGTSIATSGVANIPAATTSKYGVTKLTTLTNSSSTTLAATASAVKAAYDLANSKQEKLTSGTNIKTINGESILGSGDIVISGGSGGSSGGEDIRYFTEFTVEDFIEACESGDIVTYDTTELFNAMKSNKVICVPYRGYDKGFIVASYKSGENGEYPYMYLQKGDVEYYAYAGDYYELLGNTPTSNSTQVVEMAGGEVVFEVLDNHIYKITDPVDFLFPMPSNIQKGATIHFMSGEFGTTMEMYDVFWVNGVIPQIEPNTYYELSLMLNAAYGYNAVLTEFKLVE